MLAQCLLYSHCLLAIIRVACILLRAYNNTARFSSAPGYVSSRRRSKCRVLSEIGLSVRRSTIVGQYIQSGGKNTNEACIRPLEQCSVTSDGEYMHLDCVRILYVYPINS